MYFFILQEEAKHQLEEMNRDRERERQAQEVQPSTSHDNFGGAQVSLTHIDSLFYQYNKHILTSILNISRTNH